MEAGFGAGMSGGRPSWRAIQSLRLIQMADSPWYRSIVRDVCGRIGLSKGMSAIDLGCGPLGGLATLREIVGPTARLAGLDDKADVLRITESQVRRRRLGPVELVLMDIAQEGGPSAGLERSFDVAYARLVLINQASPAQVVRGMSSFIRPGGFIVVHELLDDLRFPTFEPPVPAIARLMDLVYETLRRAGKARDVARRLRPLLSDAGLQVQSERVLRDQDPSHAPDFIQGTGCGLLLGFETAMRQFGLATLHDIQQLAQELEAAARVEYESFSSWAMIEVVAELPRA